MLNSVGLQNPGAEYFLENELPWLRQFDTKLIANLCGSTIEDYVEVAEILGNKLDMFELNISCPNVKAVSYTHLSLYVIYSGPKFRVNLIL